MEEPEFWHSRLPDSLKGNVAPFPPRPKTGTQMADQRPGGYDPKERIAEMEADTVSVVGLSEIRPEGRRQRDAASLHPRHVVVYVIRRPVAAELLERRALLQLNRPGVLTAARVSPDLGRNHVHAASATVQVPRDFFVDASFVEVLKPEKHLVVRHVRDVGARTVQRYPCDQRRALGSTVSLVGSDIENFMKKVQRLRIGLSRPDYQDCLL